MHFFFSSEYYGQSFFQVINDKTQPKTIYVCGVSMRATIKIMILVSGLVYE